jgi:hypothetical protein
VAQLSLYSSRASLRGSGADANPDPAFHFDSETDPDFHFDADPASKKIMRIHAERDWILIVVSIWKFNYTTVLLVIYKDAAYKKVV